VDILVGTQMLAKGLDFPNVTLVGVVNADIGLHSPNFRAGERSFQLLCQVAGRAGRGAAPGRVVIQTYEPDHYAILAAAAQDYEQFYRQEIEFRRALGYPPFARIARLVFRHGTARVAADEAAKLAGLLGSEIRRRGLERTRIIGPSPAPVERLRGRYRWQIEVLAPDPVDLLGPMTLPPGWIIDVDPVNVL
jgi:primosomal protein N' (replication factor Y)